MRLRVAALGGVLAAVAAAATFALTQQGTAAPSPFRAVPAALPQPDCGKDVPMVEGVATVTGDTASVTVTGTQRTPAEVVKAAVKGAPARIHDALDHGRAAGHAFEGGQQIRLTGTDGKLIGAFNVVQHPQFGAYLAGEVWCAL